jgi:hypothetical protein
LVRNERVVFIVEQIEHLNQYRTELFLRSLWLFPFKYRGLTVAICSYFLRGSLQTDIIEFGREQLLASSKQQYLPKKPAGMKINFSSTISPSVYEERHFLK